ncbi:MAG: hypothetical protein E5X48_25210 [Mesorhizobium sp.]|uniref:hypothetical protein n=1 Tax=Mesorhizobium sp. TaxID=1871066 RepID=UPI00121BC6A7|nr:hypothetical protein [Mesorhizobium sp.]TIQ33109.1 MAG: hypothetical protein E5X48_25210 [Mesorhizobium sp.]
MNNTIRSMLSALVVIGSLFAANAAYAYERWLDITNTGHSEIVAVYASHIDTDIWGRDLLGSSVIDVGDQFRIDPRRTQGYCRFDIRLDFADGEQQFIWGVNLCEATDLVVNEYGAEIYSS